MFLIKSHKTRDFNKLEPILTDVKCPSDPSDRCDIALPGYLCSVSTLLSTELQISEANVIAVNPALIMAVMIHLLFKGL